MNEFVDMHVHSKFSIDGMSTMEDYCLIAGLPAKRVQELLYNDPQFLEGRQPFS